MPTLSEADRAFWEAFEGPQHYDDYLEWYRTTIPPEWGVPRHVEFLCGIVQKLLDGEITRLCISTPPGHTKSDTITRRLSLFQGLREPTKTVVLTGYNQRFAEKNLSYPSREIARELGILSPNATALDEWELTNGARIVVRGVGSAPTGINPIHLLVTDDPIKDRAQAQSEVERENIWDWWKGSIVQRFWPQTRAIVIATRWHEDDLIGRLKASGDPSWTFVNLPAIAEENDPIGRMPGEALWPEEKPIEFLEAQRKAMGDYEFEALFQGNPSPRSGSLFQVDRLGFVDHAPEGLPACRAWDLAATEGAGDFTAGPKISGPDREGLFYVDPLRFQHEPFARNLRIRQTAEMDGRAVRIRIPQDPGAAGKESAQALIRLLAGFSVKAEPVSGDKFLRAEPFAAQVNAFNVRVVTHGTEEGRAAARAYVEELRQAPNGKYDDQIDGSSDAFNELSAAPKQAFLIA